MEYRFNIQVEGEESGLNWVGDFVYSRPTIGVRSKINVLTTSLNGDLATLDPQIQDINYALAHLRFTLKDFPDWWRDSDFGMALYDQNVILEIYEKVVEFEKNWKIKIHGQPDTAPDRNGDSVEEDTSSDTKFVRSGGKE